MEEIDIIMIIVIAFGIYCATGLKKEYSEYKKSNHYLELNIFVRSVGVVVGSVMCFFYELSRLLA